MTTSSRAALSAMEREHPDVILCDLMMPDIDGVALYRMLDPDTRDRMVFVTAGAFTPDGRKFLDEIPNPRLEKPFQPDDLRRLIRDLLAP